MARSLRETVAASVPEDLRDRFHRRADKDCREIKTETNQLKSLAHDTHVNLPLIPGSR
jgi:hypothetical protein